MANHKELLVKYSASESIAVVSTYPPTRCGLATFSAALVDALRAVCPTRGIGVVAIADTPRHDPDIAATLTGGDQAALSAAAGALNRFDTVVLQHEYGIYPGPDGASVITLLKRITRPVITVLHTVLAHPSASQRLVLEQVVARSAAAVVMSEVARSRLIERYAVDSAKVRVIPHGSSAPSQPPAHAPATGDQADRLLLTWGLLGPGKGVEAMIDALQDLQDVSPRPRYLVAGQTHPKVRERHGESYRDMLQARARDRGVDHLVQFDDRYLDRTALTALIRRADVVVLPYESSDQVTSGVLVDAIACGRPVVATAFPHAVELCDRGAGIAVPHHDTVALAGALRAVLEDRVLAARLRRGARRIAVELSWESVATRYLALADELGHRHAVALRPIRSGGRSPTTTAAARVP